MRFLFKQALFILLILNFLHINAEENKPHTSDLSDPLPRVEIVVKNPIIMSLKLKNGMKIILMPIENEAEEIHVHGFAISGYSSLDLSKKASAVIAPVIVWESGIGSNSPEKLERALYERSIDFGIIISAFSRDIEGCVPNEELGFFLDVTHDLFMSPQFNKAALPKVIEQAKESISRQSLDVDAKFDEDFLAINTQNSEILTQINCNDLERLDFDIAKKFFSDAFGNPEDFTFVFVGDFDPEQVISLVHEKLGSIVAKESASKLSIPSFEFNFPKGITAKSLAYKSRDKEVLTRIALPILTNVNQNSIRELQVLCQIIETRLRSSIQNKMHYTHGIDVAYEFPLYPLLEHPWIILQFRCEKKLIEPILQIVFADLNQLQSIGPSQEEIATVKKLEKRTDEFWWQDYSYWVSSIVNYKKWNWDLKGLSKDEARAYPPTEIQNNLKNYFTLENYTVVTQDAN